MSAKYESGGRIDAIGRDSTGGWSYGKYQLAHSNADRFIKQSPYASEFKGIAFNSDHFRNKWKEVAKKDPKGFEAAQDAYIKKTHLDPLLSKVTATGFNLNKYSPVLKEVLFSTAVQHGPNTDVATKVIKKLGPNATEEQIIRGIYDERWSNGRRFASSTKQVQNAVKNRFFGKDGEMNKALAMLKNYHA